MEIKSKASNACNPCDEFLAHKKIYPIPEHFEKRLKTFLVGGAVRDELLGIQPKESDWVVVGAGPEEMLAQGFKPVGKDFPVFLHPHTNEEYALARTERKTSKGYGGFSFYTGKEVTLEEDLSRRDLSINAIAKDEHGKLIDPYNGQADIKAKVLRHVSPAFAEDPLRVLRLARFAAHFKKLGFSVADETMDLVKHISQSGELEALVAERVFKEMCKGLNTEHPETFFEILREGEALKILFPEFDALFGIPQRPEYHPEIDTGIHVLMCLQQSALLKANTSTRFAVLCHDFGKATTAKELLPKHIGHEVRSKKIAKRFCERLKVPNDFSKLALNVAEHHLLAHRAFELRASTVLKLFKKTGAFQQKENLTQFLLACEADARGRTGFENRDYPYSDYLLALFEAAQSANSSEIDAEKFSGVAFGQQLDQLRIQKIKQAQLLFKKSNSGKK